MSYVAGKTVIVTGGAGFIGSHLVDRLLNDNAKRVCVIDNFFLGKEENLDPAQKDFGDKLHVYREDAGHAKIVENIFSQEKPDIVFNLATKALLHSFDGPRDAFQVNTDIALTLLELLRHDAYERLIHISSSEVFGSAQSVPMDEGHPLLSETTYAAGKAAADLAVMSYCNMFDLDAVTLRPFNNYGPRQNQGALAAIIPLTVKRIMGGEKPVLEGTGEQTRDFIYVEDTVDAIMRMAEHGGFNGQDFNFGSGIETSMKEIVETLCKIMAYTGDIDYKPARPADVMRHCADVSKAEKIIGTIVKNNLEQGLEKTVEWYREQSR